MCCQQPTRSEIEQWNAQARHIASMKLEIAQLQVLQLKRKSEKRRNRIRFLIAQCREYRGFHDYHPLQFWEQY